MSRSGSQNRNLLNRRQALLLPAAAGVGLTAAGCEREGTEGQVAQISVLMPFYNSRDTIAEAVATILRQTFEDFELVLIDDGSTDGSEADLVPGNIPADSARQNQ